jgi:hypothetical protein
MLSFEQLGWMFYFEQLAKVRATHLAKEDL